MENQTASNLIMTISKSQMEMMKNKDDSSTSSNRVDDNSSVNDSTNNITTSGSADMSNNKSDKNIDDCDAGESVSEVGSSDTNIGAGVVIEASKPCSPHVSSSSIQNSKVDNDLDNQSTTVMTPVLVMSSDEKNEPNVVVEQRAGIQNDTETTQESTQSNEISNMQQYTPSISRPLQEDKRKREDSPKDQSNIPKDDLKRRKTDSSKILKIDSNSDFKKNGTKKSNSKLSNKLNDDPRSLQIAALINHRKDLLNKIRSCSSVCQMRLQSQRKVNEDEIEAFKQLSSKVLQSIKKGSSSTASRVDEGGGSLSSGGGDNRSTPRTSRGTIKKKLNVAITVQTLPSTPIRENLSKNNQSQPLTQINTDVDLSNNIAQLPQHVIPRPMIKDATPLSSKLDKTFSPIMGTVLPGTASSIVRKTSNTKAAIPMNITSTIKNDQVIKSPGRVTTTNSSNLFKNSNKRNSTIKSNKSANDLSNSLSITSPSKSETKQSNQTNPELQNLHTIRNSLRRKLSSINSTRYKQTSPSKSSSLKLKTIDSSLSSSNLPLRRKTHWDYLLEEMRWLATDFIEERKWKIASNRTISYSIQESRSKTVSSKQSCVVDKDESSKSVAFTLSNMIIVHWDKMVREGALSQEDGQVIYDKVVKSIQNHKDKDSPDKDIRDDEESQNAMDISPSSSPLSQAIEEDENEEKEDMKSFYKQMTNQIKFSTKAAKDVQSKLRRLRTTELQKSQSTWEKCNDSTTFSLTDTQLKMTRFMDSIWDLNSSATLSNVGTCGKTIAVAASLWKHREEGPQLVFCPSSALIRWRHELRQFCDLQIVTAGYAGGAYHSNTSYNFQPKDIVLCDIAFLDTGQQTDPLWNVTWSCVIIDARILPITNSWYLLLDNFLSIPSTSSRRLIIEPPLLKQSDHQMVDSYAIKLAFIHRPLKRKRSRYTKYEIFSWAKQECYDDSNFIASIINVLQEATNPFTFHHDDVEERITPLTLYYKNVGDNDPENILRKRKSRDLQHCRHNLLQNKWTVRKCTMPDLQYKSYVKCCRSLRGVFGIAPPKISNSIHRVVSIANSIFSLRQTCLHADLYSVLKMNGIVGYAKIQEFLYGYKTNCAQPNMTIAQEIASGSAKFCELFKILKDRGIDCDMEIENDEVIWKKCLIESNSATHDESVIASKNAGPINGTKGSNNTTVGDNGNKAAAVLASPSRVTRKSPRLQQEATPEEEIAPTEKKKILILASLPEVQVLLCMFLNACGIPHELFSDRHLVENNQDMYVSESNVSMCASNWTESQRSLIRFYCDQSDPQHSSFCNNILVLSPLAATQHQGGLRINYADLIIDVDSDWSGRSIDLVNSIAMACTVRKDEDDDVECIRLVCANTCEEHFLSKGFVEEGKIGDESSDDDEPSLLVETDDYGHIISAYDEETNLPKLYLGKNIICHRGSSLRDVLGIADLPVDYTTGTDLVFLQRPVFLDSQVEIGSSEESDKCIIHLWKYYHQNISKYDEENLAYNDKIDILFGYIFAQVERLKSLSSSLSKTENYTSIESSVIWNSVIGNTTLENQALSIFHPSSFANVTSRQDLLTLPIRIYCEFYGRKYFHLCNNSNEFSQSQQLDIADSWRKSGLGSSSLDQILPLLVYGKPFDEYSRGTMITPRKKKRIPETTTPKDDTSNEATSTEKKKRKKNNIYGEEASSSYRGNIYANLFASSLFSEIIPDGSQGMEYVLYTPPTFPGLMPGWKNTKKNASLTSLSLPSRKPTERSNRVFKKKKKISSTNNPFLMTSATQSMDLDDLTDDFLDSMADANSPFLDFDLSSDFPTTSTRNDDTAPINLEPMDSSIVPSSNAVSTNFEPTAITPSYQIPSAGLEESKNTSAIAAMDALNMGVDALDHMFYDGDHDAHLTPTGADDFLPHLSDNMLDLDFGDTANPAPISIGVDPKLDEFDDVDMMGLGDNLDSIAFMNNTTTVISAPPTSNDIEEEQETVKQMNQLTWEDDYGFLGCGLLPVISDSVYYAATTPYPTASYRGGTADSFYNDLYNWGYQPDCNTSMLDCMVLYVNKLSDCAGQGYKNGSTSARVKKPKKLHGFVMSDDVFAKKADDQLISEHKSNKATAKNLSTSNFLMRRKIRTLVNKSFLSKDSGIPTSILQHDSSSPDIHQHLIINESGDTSTDIVLAPAIQKLSGPDSKTGDKARATASAHRAALRRSLVAPQHVDFGPFSLGFISSSSGFSGIVPPMSQVGIGLPLGVQAPTRESDFMREPWSEEEDVRLKDAAARFCFNWHIVSRSVTDIRRNPGIVLDGVEHRSCALGHSSTQEVWRCARQCRERWQAFAKAQPSLAKDVRKSERLLREMASVPPRKVPQSLGSLFSNFASSTISESSSLIGNSTVSSPSMLLSPAFYKRDSTSNKESSSSMFNIAQQYGEYGYLKGRLPALQESASKADYRSNHFSVPGSQQAIAQPHVSHVQIAQSPTMITHRTSSSQQQQAEVWPLQLLDYYEKQRLRTQGAVVQTSSSSRVQSNSTPSSSQSSTNSASAAASSSVPHQQQQSKPSSQQQQRSHQVVHSQVPHQQVPQQRRQSQVQPVQHGGKNIAQVAQVMSNDRIRMEAAIPPPASNNASAPGVTINNPNTANLNPQQQPYTVVTNPSYQQQPQQPPPQLSNPQIVSTTKNDTNNT